MNRVTGAGREDRVSRGPDRDPAAIAVGTRVPLRWRESCARSMADLGSRRGGGPVRPARSYSETIAQPRSGWMRRSPWRTSWGSVNATSCAGRPNLGGRPRCLLGTQYCSQRKWKGRINSTGPRPARLSRVDVEPSCVRKWLKEGRVISRRPRESQPSRSRARQARSRAARSARARGEAGVRAHRAGEDEEAENRHLAIASEHTGCSSSELDQVR
jgi:hypothetical protein